MMKPGRLIATVLTALVVSAAISAVDAQQSPTTPSLNPLARIELPSLKGFAERPLFAPSRKPVQAPGEVIPTTPQATLANDQPHLRLTGVIEGPGESVAIVQSLDANETLRLRLGDQVNGWLVTSIEPVTMRLTLADRDEDYRLFSPSAP